MEPISSRKAADNSSSNRGRFRKPVGNNGPGLSRSAAPNVAASKDWIGIDRAAPGSSDWSPGRLVPVSVSPRAGGTWPHECNGLCGPTSHVEVVWVHPAYSFEFAPEALSRTLRLWLDINARLVGRAELPPREEDGWIAWTIAFDAKCREGTP